METKNLPAKIPTLQELITESEADNKQNALTVILNQEPPKQWISRHPFVSIETVNEQGIKSKEQLPYIPINRVEYMLTRIFGKWWVEIKQVQILANSITVTVRLFVVNPITKETEWQDGVGASAIQTDKGAGAMDWNAAKASGVQMAAPSAETYAIKDAAEKFGKIFGKDLTRKDTINYNSLLKQSTNDRAEEKEKQRIIEYINGLTDISDLELFYNANPEYSGECKHRLHELKISQNGK